MVALCTWIWKVWGKGYSKKLTNIAEGKEDEEKRESLERKIQMLKDYSKELKESDDELKVSKMIQILQDQLEEKEVELKEVNKKLKK